MTLPAFLVLWAGASVVTSLAMGRWLGARESVDQLVASMPFRLHDD